MCSCVPTSTLPGLHDPGKDNVYSRAAKRDRTADFHMAIKIVEFCRGILVKRLEPPFQSLDCFPRGGYGMATARKCGKLEACNKILVHYKCPHPKVQNEDTLCTNLSISICLYGSINVSG